MGKIIRWAVLSLCLFTVAACGDDEAGTADAADNADATVVFDSMVTIDAVVYDAAPPDAVDCPAIAFGAIGGNCVDDDDCGLGEGFFCIDEGEGWPADGFCTRMNCLIAADCGAGAFCAHLLPFGGGDGDGDGDGDGPPDYMCLPNCCEQGVCPTGALCQERIMGMLEIETGTTCLPGDPAAEDGDACDGPEDCNVNSICQTGYEAPGGLCMTFGCDFENDTGCSGEDSVCAPAGDSGFGICFQTCTLGGGECREAEGYKCFPAGFFGVCAHAGVGDTCTEDSDCGVAPWDCQTVDPDGYCTPTGCTDGEPCSEDSYCFDADGAGVEPSYCLISCPTPDSTDGCRPGYTCLSRGAGNGCVYTAGR